MKQTFTLTVASVLLFFFSVTGLSAQRSCGTLAHTGLMRASNPKKYISYLQRQAMLQEKFSSHHNLKAETSTIYTIPVVVHVVYKNAAENLPDSQIVAQINVLNEDFARLNADTANTPSAFNVAGSTSFRFCLAQRDPNDDPTNGIERRLTTVPLFNDSTYDINYFATGGLDAWDVDRYLNIWVCAMDSSLLGYAEMPDVAPHSNTYGAVINYLYFGRGGNTLSPFNLGRTTTHEVGHCLGLRHIWGDDGGTCSADDGIPDTPLQADATSGCLVFPAFDSCTPSGNGIMFMNYMDYSDDTCMNMFTLGQAGWMDFEMGFDYPSLLSSDGCQPVVLTDNDVWVREILSPGGQYCGLSVSPVVRIKNYGTIPITNVDFNYSFDGGPVSVYSWSGSLASLATTLVSLPSATLTSGVHSFTVFTSNPNAATDPVALNDTLSSSFELVSTGAALPLTEGFEGATFPPAGWNILNADQDYSWTQTNSAAKTGTYSVFVENYSYSNTGALDELLTPILDLTSVTNPILTFDVGYTYYYLSGPVPLISTDSLEVLISTDCGTSFTSLYYKGGNDLSTAPPTDAYFIPGASEWRNELVPLNAYATDSQVVVMFRNINGYGNNLFLDNINLTSATGMAQQNAIRDISLYPNPAASLFTLDLGGLDRTSADVQVFDVMGKLVSEWHAIQTGTKVTLKLNNVQQGMYCVKILTGSFTRVLPLVIDKR